MQIRGIPDSVERETFNQAMELLGITDEAKVLEMWVRDGFIRLEVESSARSRRGEHLTHSILVPIKDREGALRTIQLNV